VQDSSTTPENSTVVRSKKSPRLARAALHTAFLLSEDLGTRLAERWFTSPRRFPRPERERAVLALARESIVEVTLRAPRWNGMRVPVRTWHWGLGPTVMLVHGWEGRGSQLGAFVAPLVAAGMSVVAFDAPGHGDSPEDRLYLPDLADCVADVAAAIGPLHGIVAHSFGAAAVLLAGVQHGVRAARNVMVAPNVLIDDSVRKFASIVGLDESDRITFEQRIAQSTGLPLSALQLPRLASHREESLIVFHDREDREVGFEHGEQLAATWPDADLRPTISLGHRRILRDESVIAQLVEFLGSDVEPPVSDLVRYVDRQLALASSD
jgi:pimeloyl-ACP methyl ester carboxylesterase